MNCRVVPRSRSRMLKRSFASTTIERPSGVSSASEASCAASASFFFGVTRRGDERRCHAIAERDGAGLVEQQCLDVTGCLDRPPTHREHVSLHEPVHPGDPIADSKAPIVVGIRQTRSATR